MSLPNGLSLSNHSDQGSVGGGKYSSDQSSDHLPSDAIHFSEVDKENISCPAAGTNSE